MMSMVNAPIMIREVKELGSLLLRYRALKETHHAATMNMTAVLKAQMVMALARINLHTEPTHVQVDTVITALIVNRMIQHVLKVTAITTDTIVINGQALTPNLAVIRAIHFVFFLLKPGLFRKPPEIVLLIRELKMMRKH